MITPDKCLEMNDYEKENYAKIEEDFDRQLQLFFDRRGGKVEVSYKETILNRVETALIQNYTFAGWTVVKNNQLSSDGKASFTFTATKK